MAMDLNKLVEPEKAVPSSIGDIYLYRLRTSDYEGLAALAGSTSTDRIRSLLPFVASLVHVKSFKEERPPLSDAEIKKLSDIEVEELASQYAASLLHPPSKESGSTQPEQQEDEAASTFLERLLQHELAEFSLLERKLREKITSSNSIFEKVRENALKLSSTVGAFDRLFKSQNQVDSLSSQSFDRTNAMTEQFERQARERAEELQMVRLTGKMTAESAETLRSLAEAATTLLEQMDQRDKKNDRDTSRQITIAVRSVVISAVLALLALIISAFSYLQDRNNNEAEDGLKSELMNFVKETNQQRALVKLKIQQLETELEKLKVNKNNIRPEVVLPAKPSSAAR